MTVKSDILGPCLGGASCLLFRFGALMIVKIEKRSKKWSKFWVILKKWTKMTPFPNYVWERSRDLKNKAGRTPFNFTFNTVFDSLRAQFGCWSIEKKRYTKDFSRVAGQKRKRSPNPSDLKLQAIFYGPGVLGLQ